MKPLIPPLSLSARVASLLNDRHMTGHPMERPSHADDPSLRVLRPVPWTESGYATVTAIPEPLFEGEFSFLSPLDCPALAGQLFTLSTYALYFYFFFQVFLFLSSLVLSPIVPYFIIYCLFIIYCHNHHQTPPLLCRPVGTRNSTFFLPHRWPILNCRRIQRPRPQQR